MDSVEILKFFIAPITTGSFILVVQFFLLPKLERNKTAQIEFWKERYKSFIMALELVDKKYGSLDFGNGNKGVFNEESEVNKVYTKLLILSGNKDIPEKFWKFFDNSRKKLTPVERGEFILLLQKELGQKNKTKPEKIPFFQKLV